MTRDARTAGGEPDGPSQPAQEPDVARDGLEGGHWHTIEGLRDCTEGCMPPDWITTLEDNILRNHDINLPVYRGGHVNCEGCAIRRRRIAAGIPTPVNRKPWPLPPPPPVVPLEIGSPAMEEWLREGWRCPTHDKVTMKTSSIGRSYRGCPDCREFERLL